MSSRRTVVRNVVCNGAGMAAHLLAGFVVLPLLVTCLGQERYGLWVLIASLTGYFGMLPLGLPAAVGRHLAFHHARGDRAGLNAVLSTSLALLSATALLVLLGTLAVRPLFFRLIPVPADQADAVNTALLIVGCNLALTFCFQIFESTLWALQRFDLLNAVNVPMLAVRTALTFYLIPRGGGLVTLALIVLGTNVGAAVAMALLCIVLEPGLRVWPTYVSREQCKKLFGYGAWYFLLSMEEPLLPPLINLFIGYRLGAWFVTPYTVGSRLTGYATAVMRSLTGVLTPLATALHARREHTEQQRLVLAGGRCCLALGLLFLTLFLALGRPLIDLWLRGAEGVTRALAYEVLVVLALGEALPLSQWVSHSTILGMGRHKVMAWLSLAEMAATVALAALLVGRFQLWGVALAFAVPGALVRGACQAVYVCRLVGLPFRSYVAGAWLPAAGAAAPPALALALAVRLHEPGTWPELVAYGGLFTAAYLLVAGLLLGGPELRGLVRGAPRRLVGAAGGLRRRGLAAWGRPRRKPPSAAPGPEGVLNWKSCHANLPCPVPPNPAGPETGPAGGEDTGR